MSIAVEAYTRVAYMIVEPEKIYEKQERFRRDWLPRQVTRIAQHVVQTPGGLDHPHRQVLEKHFPEYMKEHGTRVPLTFPSRHVQNKLEQQIKNKESKIFLSGQVPEHILKEKMDHNRRMSLSISRKMQVERLRQQQPSQLVDRNKNKSSINKTFFRKKYIMVEMQDRACQTDSNNMVHRKSKATQVYEPMLPPISEANFEATVSTPSQVIADTSHSEECESAVVEDSRVGRPTLNATQR